MTEPVNQNSAQPPGVVPTAIRPSTFLGFIMVMTMLIGAGGTIGMWHYLKEEQGGGANSNVSVTAPVMPPTFAQNHTTAVEQQVQQIQTKIEDLALRLEKLEQQTSSETDENSTLAFTANSDAGLTQLKNQVTTLAISLHGLETTMEQTSQTTDKNKTAAQGSLAVLVSLTQLRAAVTNGEPFNTELQNFKNLAKNDAVLQEAITKLELSANTGVLTTASLREEFSDLIGLARTAMRRAGAQSWQDRVTSELEGLVSIRRLDPEHGESNPLGSIDNDLKQNRLYLVSDKVNKLPEVAQTILKEWSLKVEAKQNVEKMLNNIANHLATPEQESNTPIPDLESVAP